MEIAEEMLYTPVAHLAARTWSRATAADLRRMLVRAIEEHIERRLVTPPLLETV
jgi:DNA repair protein RecO (recombination protein O)